MWKGVDLQAQFSGEQKLGIDIILSAIKIAIENSINLSSRRHNGLMVT
jgi:hypothetical protein